MREVRETDDADAAHAGGLEQHLLGIAQMLQGLQLQHHVEAAVLEQRQAVLEVELQHVDAAPGAGQQLVVVDFDTVAAAALDLLQIVEQGPVTAAQVKHPGAGRHQLGDQGLFGRDLRDSRAAHRVNSAAMRSKLARSTPW